MEETLRVRLPAWVGPVGLLGFAWGVSRLRRGESSTLTWGLTIVSAPMALAGIAQMANRRREDAHGHEHEHEHEDARDRGHDRNPVASMVGTALTGLVGALAR